MHWLKRLAGLFLILSNIGIFAQEAPPGLEIPEIYVYGERVVKLVPYKKRVFPFVKIYDYPIMFSHKKHLVFKRFNNPFIEKINLRYRIFAWAGKMNGISFDGATEHFYYPSRFNIKTNYGGKFSGQRWKAEAGGKIYLRQFSPYFSYLVNTVKSDSSNHNFINGGTDIYLPYFNINFNLCDTKTKNNEMYFRFNGNFLYGRFALQTRVEGLTGNNILAALSPEYSFPMLKLGFYVSPSLIFPVIDAHYINSISTFGISVFPEIGYTPIGYYFKDNPFIIGRDTTNAIFGGTTIKGFAGIWDWNLTLSYHYNYWFPYIENDTLKSVKTSGYRINISGKYQIQGIHINGEIGYFNPANDTVKNYNIFNVNVMQKWSYFSLSQDILYRKANTTSFIPLLGIEINYPLNNIKFILKADNLLNYKTTFWDNHTLSGITFYLGITYKFQQ